jgi:peptidoglycan/LPS O-acetylase OafA/YrhL
LLPGGFVGVDLFFVISGFVVSMTTKRLAPLGFKRLLLAFYRRRVIRILPAALFFLLATQLIAVLFVPVRERLTVADMTAAAAAAGVSNIILWLKAGDYFSPGASLNPFTHTWSLAVEEQFYVLFPAFALLIWKHRDNARAGGWGISILAVCTMASLAVSARLTELYPVFAFHMTPARFWELAAGILLFIFVDRDARQDVPKVPKPGLVTLLSLIGAALLVLSLWLTGSTPFPGALPPVCAATVLIYVVFVAPTSFLSRLLSLPFIRYFGLISYSLYLWHWGVIVLMRWTTGIESSLEKATAFVLSIALADLTYRAIERPIRSSSWLSSRPDWIVVAMGLAGIGLVGTCIAGLTVLRPQLTLSVTGNTDVWWPFKRGKGGKCTVERGRYSFAGGGTRYDFEPRQCGSTTDDRHLFVIGDSHAWAYQRLVGNIVGAEGMPASIYMAGGCSLMPEDPGAIAECASFVDAAVRDVAGRAKTGDILFLPGLRTQRYRDMAEPELRKYHPPKIYTEAIIAAELERLRPFSDMGVRVIFEAPKPVYKYAPVRCSDWFNRWNPHCQVEPVMAAEQQLRRANMLGVFADIMRREPRIELWDPFPLLCPAELCLAMKDGKPLVSDGDHLSGYANDLLSPHFFNFINSR